MLFNAPEFIFAFLPVTLFLFHVLRINGKATLALLSLLFSSLFFYGWWNPAYLILIITSILFNYIIGKTLIHFSRHSMPRKVILATGIICNLLFIGYYKYLMFFLTIYANFSDTPLHLEEIILPLGISFFTFTQIAYLSDLHLERTKPDNILTYSLFITFFPQLIAGPIVHHRELAGQFEPATTKPMQAYDFSLGLTIFTVGLFKKVILADTLASYASPIFAKSSTGITLDFMTAWSGALAYTFQLYFDFSGYSDMAIGLGLLFAIHIPINFLSPYKATSIISFWHRWHITLSHWLRDYLYISLGGNRRGRTRQIIAVGVTMLLGGLWHGANWTFIIWGLGHSILLGLNHISRMTFGEYKNNNFIIRSIFWALTFASITMLWVVFRAPDLESAWQIISAMLNPFVMPQFAQAHLGGFSIVMETYGFVFIQGQQLISNSLLNLLAVSFIICIACPNLYEFTKPYNPAQPAKGVVPKTIRLNWKPNFFWAIITAFGFVYASINSIISTSEFLYYQF